VNSEQYRALTIERSHWQVPLRERIASRIFSFAELNEFGVDQLHNNQVRALCYMV
jgi:hypothetical protein